MKNSITLAISIFCSIIAHAQTIAIDSNGDPVFFVPQANSAKIEFSQTDNIVTKLTFSPNVRAITQYTNGAANLLRKSRSVQFSAGITADDKVSNLLKLKQNQAGVELGLGYQYTIDTIQNLGLMAYPFTYSWGLTLKGSMSPINYINPEAAEPSSKTEYLQELKAEMPFNLYNRSGRWAIALNLAYKYVVNKDKLLKYSQIDQFALDSTIAVYDQQDGRFGSIAYDCKFRASVALPIYWECFNFNPYGSFSTTNFATHTSKIGISINLTENSEANRNWFSNPKSVGIGIDWTNTGAGFSNAFLFIQGSFDVFKLYNRPRNNVIQPIGKPIPLL